MLNGRPPPARSAPRAVARTMDDAETDGARGFAVTTRSRLRGARLFLPMLLANRRRQLAATPGSLRFASVVTSPRQFWTVSVWRSRDDMQAFIRSGAHETFMWNVSRWFRSFWLIRWAPTDDERGHWNGLRLSGGRPTVGADGRRGARHVLAGIPDLLAAVGPDGRPSYDPAPAVRWSRNRLAGGAGGHAPGHGGPAPGGPRRLAGVPAPEAPPGSRSRGAAGGLGAGRPPGAPPARGVPAPRGLSVEDCGEVRRVLDRWSDAWVMRWRPENEFGHRDGLRIRRERLGLAAGSPSVDRGTTMCVRH